MKFSTHPPMNPGLNRLARTLAASAAMSASIFMSLATVSVAHAWGTEGHQVVALIAQSQLTPKAKAEVGRLLAQEPGETLASVSTWADEHRNPSTASWHYVNFPRGDCVYDEQRDCPDGYCVVGAIKRQLQVLASNAPDDKRLTALKYVVHFVADVHQPLHAGFMDDRGGNKYQLQAFMRGSNLHAVWDSGLIKNLSDDAESMATRLQGPRLAFPVTDLDPVTAAQESCRIVSMPGFYPDRLVGQYYIDRFTPVAERRLAIAGGRLAGVLNGAFR
jgi:nuclease S1